MTAITTPEMTEFLGGPNGFHVCRSHHRILHALAAQYDYISVWDLADACGLSYASTCSAVYTLRKILPGTGYDIVTEKWRGYRLVRAVS